MIDWFLWNNIRCTAYGIHVLTQPALIRPAERTTFTTVPGRSGSLTTLEGEDVYDDFILSAECIIENTNRLPEINAWLRGSGTVTFANRQGGFYVARIVNQISFEKILRGNPHRSFAVNFRCQPFFYLLDVADITINNSGTIITNPGSVFSEPMVKVTMNGNAQIIIGGTYFELSSINGTVTIDTPLMETHMDYLCAITNTTASGTPSIAASYGAIGVIGRGETLSVNVPVALAQGLANGTYGGLCLYEPSYNFGSSQWSDSYMRIAGTNDSVNKPYLLVVYSGSTAVG